MLDSIFVFIISFWLWAFISLPIIFIIEGYYNRKIIKTKITKEKKKYKRIKDHAISAVAGFIGLAIYAFHESESETFISVLIGFIIFLILFNQLVRD